MNESGKYLKYILIAIVNVLILFTSVQGQGFLQNTGFSVETTVGHISVFNVEGTQYGLRFGAWPKSWLSAGFETFVANNLSLKRTNLAILKSQTQQVNFSRYHLFVGFHLRMFESIKPYVIGTFGRSNEPSGGVGAIGSNDIFYLNRNSFTVKTGVAFENPKLRLAFEFGGGSMGSGHSETNMTLSYNLKQLPKANRLPNFTVSSGLHNFTSFTGPYNSEDITGFDINLEVENNGRTREYNVGIFFVKRGEGNVLNNNFVQFITENDLDRFDNFSTGVINLGTGWHINGNHKFFDYIDVIPGVQMLIWAEGDDFILPAVSLGLNSHYQLSRFVPFVKMRSLATYSKNNGFLSGLTSTFGVGLTF